MSENSFSSVTDLLFVYGTLMRGNSNEFTAHLQHSSTYIGVGWFWGKLYQIDWFPGAVYDPLAETRVWGELYQLWQPDLSLVLFDSYEGIHDQPPAYVRLIVPVNVADDKKMRCHTYLYNLPTTNLTVIDSGRFEPLI